MKIPYGSLPGLKPGFLQFPSLDGLDCTELFRDMFVSIWSVFAMTGCLLILMNHHIAPLRMCNVSLTISTVIWLHIYIVVLLLACNLRDQATCVLEFLMLSILLPFGSGLCQLNNIQMLDARCTNKMVL
jgi:hypothetical protein